MKVKTTGQAAAVVLKADVEPAGLPSWSPTGEWILYGRLLVSPDGTKTRVLADHRSPEYVFSRDGKRLYGLRPKGERQELFSIDLGNELEHVIGEVSGTLVPGQRPFARHPLQPGAQIQPLDARRFHAQATSAPRVESVEANAAVLEARVKTTPFASPAAAEGPDDGAIVLRKLGLRLRQRSLARCARRL